MSDTVATITPAAGLPRQLPSDPPSARALSVPHYQQAHLDPSQFLLVLDDLKTYFHTSEGTYKAVDGVSFAIAKGQTLGAVSYTHLTLPTNREV